VKYNSTGTVEWVARYTYDHDYSDDVAGAVAINASGNLYVAGTSHSSGYQLPGRYSYFTLFKYNAAGKREMTARYNGGKHADDYPAAIALDKTNNVYVTGTSYSHGWRSSVYTTIKYVVYIYIVCRRASLVKRKNSLC